MNIMNVNNTAFTAKLPVSRIKMARNVNNVELPVNNYVKEMLADHSVEIERAANSVNRDIVIAQRGNLVLANSGAKTSVIDMSKMQNGRELIDGIINNLRINA